MNGHDHAMTAEALMDTFGDDMTPSQLASIHASLAVAYAQAGAWADVPTPSPVDDMPKLVWDDGAEDEPHAKVYQDPTHLGYLAMHDNTWIPGAFESLEDAQAAAIGQDQTHG